MPVLDPTTFEQIKALCRDGKGKAEHFRSVADAYEQRERALRELLEAQAVIQGYEAENPIPEQEPHPGVLRIWVQPLRKKGDQYAQCSSEQAQGYGVTVELVRNGRKEAYPAWGTRECYTSLAEAVAAWEVAGVVAGARDKETLELLEGWEEDPTLCQVKRK